jgi:CheY-like chemotaxis protein
VEEKSMVRILVVDDSAVDRRLVGALLEKEGGLEVEFAEDGQQAMELVQAQPPDLVVTDLQMPKMDGLKLVTALRLHHPDVPAVVITAHGSEQIAVRALAEGAASYVAKSQLAERLADTVGDVLSLAAAVLRRERLVRCAVKTELQFELDNDPALIDPLVDVAQQVCGSTGVCDRPDLLRVGVALEEAVKNAILRGNLEIDFDQSRDWAKAVKASPEDNPLRTRIAQAPYASRKVFVHLLVNEDEAKISVRDEGPGFDTSAMPKVVDPATLGEERGRGLVLMRSFMDEVSFNDRGNEVTLVKRRAVGR